jgi:hypothetical protein
MGYDSSIELAPISLKSQYLHSMSISDKGFISSLLSKIDKAKRYVREPERFSITSDQAQVHSDHGTRNLMKKDNQWICDCNFHQEHLVCSHIIALKELNKIEKIDQLEI